MIRTVWLLLSFLFAITELKAQQVFEREKRDYVWLLGYDSNPTNPIFGGTRIDFNYAPPLIAYEYRNLNFERTNASMSDIEGNLLFYTNGIAVHNYLNELIENGEGLNPDPYTQHWIDGGYSLPQGALVLPHPGIPNRYAIFHSTISVVIPAIADNNYIPLNCYYTTVDIASGEVGTIPEKNVLILSDTFDFGKLTAVRHANGRDWWIATQEYYVNRYYLMLLSPEGVSVESSQTLGLPRPTGLGQAVFSPDGGKYVLFSTISVQDGQFLDIYDYERCSGQLDNHISITYNDTAFSGGVAISPNSRFLYVSSNRYVYQYDLEAPDIEVSKETIAVYDGFQSPPPLATTFFLAQLAPDDKIYISASNSVPYLHVIHNPNAKGTACQMEQHGVQLPTLNAFGIPNSPYYGLGPHDGSPCDTLGIDHHPQADFRYVTETSTVNFYDYSRFFPTEWFWTFGDGGSSTERDPIHTYTQSGVYEVCLIVSNANASDTLCQEVEVIVTGTEEAVAGKALLKVFPNPAKDYVVLQVPGGEAVLRHQAVGPLSWTLHDALGREVRRVVLQHPEAQTVASLENVARGMYFWHLTASGITVQTGKLSVVK